MNGSNPIFPLFGIGQAPSVQTGHASENGNTAFAENLTAALAGLSLTTVIPAQQSSETQVASFQGGLINGSLDATTTTIDQAALRSGVQGSGAFGPVGKTDVGSADSVGIETAGNVEIDANAGPLASTKVSDSTPLPEDLRTSDAVTVAKKPASIADVDRAPVSAEGVNPAPSTATKTDKPSQPEIQQPVPISTQTTAVRPSGDVNLGQPLRNDGDRLRPASPINPEDRSPLVKPAVHETAPMDEAPQAATRIPGESVPDVSAGAKNMPISEASLADASLDAQTRSTAPVSVIAAEGQIRPTPSPQLTPGFQTAVHRMSTLSQELQPEQPVIKKSLGADGGASLLHEASNLVASRGESVLPARRRSAGAHEGEAVHHMMRPHAAETSPNGPSEGRPSSDRQGAHAVTVNEPVGKSAPGVYPASAAQTAFVDGGFRPTAEFGGFDRLQPALSVEGPPLDSMRFEAASNLGQSRAQAPSAHSPAGAQIALQIVRSLPEGIDRFSLHLQPAELGSVDIQLDFEGGGRLSALITVERPETLELLQRDSRLLERSLGDSGLKLASDGLSFALKQDHQQQQQGQGFQEQAQAREAAFRAGRAYDDTPDTEQVPSATRVDGLRLLDIET